MSKSEPVLQTKPFPPEQLLSGKHLSDLLYLQVKVKGESAFPTSLLLSCSKIFTRISLEAQ